MTKEIQVNTKYQIREREWETAGTRLKKPKNREWNKEKQETKIGVSNNSGEQQMTSEMAVIVVSF